MSQFKRQTLMANKRCCAQFMPKGGGCPVHSKIKMVVQLKPEFKTKNSSPTFYSWVYQNPTQDRIIIFGTPENEGMLQRIERFYTNKYNKIQFFKQGVEAPIYTHE